MSEASKAYREAAKEKAHRLANGDDYKNKRIDASGYEVPGMMDTASKTGDKVKEPRAFATGPKPLNPRMFKRGGKVEGASGTHHAGKKPRAKRDMGGAMPVAGTNGAAPPMMNLPAAAQAQIANATRTPNPQGMLGSRPVQSWMARAGGIKTGGRVKKADGGGDWIKDAVKHPGALHKELKVPEGKKIPEKKLEKAEHSKNPVEAKRARLAETLKGLHKAGGGEVPGNSEITGTRPTGGRLARAAGGKTSGKGKFNVNVIIADRKPDSMMGAAAPPMGPPPGHPIPPPVLPPGAMGGGMPPGMPGAGMPPMGGGMPPGAAVPPMRAAGGRTYPKMNAGALGAEGRLEKLKSYGDKYAKEANKGN